MRLGESDSVVTFARAEHVDEETEAVEVPDEEDELNGTESEEMNTGESVEETSQE